MLGGGVWGGDVPAVPPGPPPSLSRPRRAEGSGAAGPGLVSGGAAGLSQRVPAPGPAPVPLPGPGPPGTAMGPGRRRAALRLRGAG